MLILKSFKPAEKLHLIFFVFAFDCWTICLKKSLDHIPANIISDDLCIKESHGPMGVNNSDDIYKKVKTYLNTKQQLKQLACTLKKESEQMLANNEEIKRLADDIRKQAQAALVTH